MNKLPKDKSGTTGRRLLTEANSLETSTTECQNGNAQSNLGISENQKASLPSQWNLSDWLREIDRCPKLLANTSLDKQKVEGWLRRWKELGCPNLEFPREEGSSSSLQSKDQLRSESHQESSYISNNIISLQFVRGNVHNLLLQVVLLSMVYESRHANFY